MLISSTHFRNSTTRLLIFRISVGQMVIHPTKQTPTDDYSKTRPISSPSGVFSTLSVILVIPIESKHRSALVRINLTGREKKATLELPNLLLFVVCLHSNIIVPLRPLKQCNAKIPHELQLFFCFFWCSDEASSVGLWTVNFTVEADAHTHSNLTC